MLDHKVEQSPPWENWGMLRANNWQLKRCWWPRQCNLTGQKLWGRLAYRGEHWITGPGEPVVDYYWVEKSEFLLWRIKHG